MAKGLFQGFFPAKQVEEGGIRVLIDIGIPCLFIGVLCLFYGYIAQVGFLRVRMRVIKVNYSFLST